MGSILQPGTNLIIPGTNLVPIDIAFVNPVQENFVYCNKRNQGFSGGFGNGKSFGGSIKGILLLATFPRYRIAISRYRSSDLIKSTMSTFFKLCNPELYSEAYGGRRNDRDGYLRLVNGSEVFWIHLDDYSENSLRGLEVNSHLGDQMEEVAEGVYITIDSRIERWDMAEIPPHLNVEYFPLNKFTGKPCPPSYNMVLCNPDTILHWIYRRYHPDSVESQIYADSHAYFTASTHDNPAISESLKAEMRRRDPAWVDRFYWGKWGVAGGAIHYISDQSILTEQNLPDSELEKLYNVIQKDGIKMRVMDHGETAPTTCGWFAWLSPKVLADNYGIQSCGIHVCYREYYMPNRVISEHRHHISDLSRDEHYMASYADPQIFKKTTQKYGGYWTVADEYTDPRISEPPITWIPADNNEMATRNAVAEMLMLNAQSVNPWTGLANAPTIYFIKRRPSYPNGCIYTISQTQSARHKKIGSENGQDLYSDERDPNITDHAYDIIRYYCIIPKMTKMPDAPKVVPQFSFNAHLNKIRRYRRVGNIYVRR